MLAGRRTASGNLIDNQRFNPAPADPSFSHSREIYLLALQSPEKITPRIKTSGWKIQSNPCGALMLPKQQDALGIGMQVAVCRKRRYHDPDGQAITHIYRGLVFQCVIAEVCLSRGL